MMSKSGIALLVFIAIRALFAANVQSCGGGCNCRFGNIQGLIQLIEAKVKSALANESCKLIIFIT